MDVNAAVGERGLADMPFRWLLFNLFTAHRPESDTKLYFSGRVYVVARMLLAMELAVKDWQTMGQAERARAQTEAWMGAFSEST